MRDRIRAHAPILITALLVAALTTGGPALATAAFDAMNADKVDGKHAVGAAASADQRAGKLVATGATGFLPNGITKKAVNADKLDGVDSISFARLPLFARVSGTGAIVVGRGAGASHPNTGVYRVFLTDPVHRCGHVATANDGAHVVRTLPGEQVEADTNVVEVRCTPSTAPRPTVASPWRWSARCQDDTPEHVGGRPGARRRSPRGDVTAP